VPSQETRPIPFGYTARQTNLVDWYPFVAPYITGEGWIANQAYFFGEHLAYELADFDVSIRITDDDPTLTIAASAAGDYEGEWTHYRHPAARNFAWSVSHEYQVTSTNVDGITINSYAFPYHAQAGEAVLNTTAEALELFGELYGEYPRDTLSVVEADFLDGMEYDGMYFLSDGFYNLYQGTPGEYLIAIAAHETAHQWFYASVGNDQALEPWLDEALCTYNELVYYENLHPEALDWWHTYRVDYYEPRGWVDSTIYNPDGYRAYRDAVYLNGALFLEELRNLIGDAPFQQFLAAYVAHMDGQLATADDFFSILDQHSNTDYRQLMEKYFFMR
jgi:aminopeptidase N